MRIELSQVEIKEILAGIHLLLQRDGVNRCTLRARLAEKLAFSINRTPETRALKDKGGIEDERCKNTDSQSNIRGC